MHGGKRFRKKRSQPEVKKEPKGPQPVNLTTDCAQEVNQKNSKLNWTKKTNSPQGSPVRSSQTGQAWGKKDKPGVASSNTNPADFPSLGDAADASSSPAPAPDTRKRQDKDDIRNIDNWDTTHDLDFGSLPLPACPVDSNVDEPKQPASPPVKMDANSYNHHSTNDRHANNRRFNSPRTQQPSGRRDRFQRENYSSPRSNNNRNRYNDRYSSHNRRGPQNPKPNFNRNQRNPPPRNNQKLCSDLLFEDELPDAAMQQPKEKSSQDIRNKGKAEATAQKSNHDAAPQSVVHQHIRHNQEARRNQEKGKFGGRKDTRHGGRGRTRQKRDFSEIDLKEKPWHRNQRFPESAMFPWSKKSDDFQRHQQLLTDQEKRVENNFDMVRVQLRKRWESDRIQNEQRWAHTVQKLSDSNKQNNNEIQRSQNWRKGRGPVDHRDKQEDESLIDGIGESAELKNTKHKKGGRQKGRDDKKSTKIVNSSGQTKWEKSKTKAIFSNQPNQRTDEPHLNAGKQEVSEIIQTQTNEPDSQEHSISLLQIRQDQQILDSKNPRFPRRNSEPVRPGQAMVQPQWPNDPSAPEMYTQQSAPAPNMHQNQQLHLPQQQPGSNQTPGQQQPFPPPLYNHIRAVPQALQGQQGQRIIMMQRTVPGFPQMGQPNASIPNQAATQPQPGSVMRLPNGQFMVATPNLTNPAQYVHKPANVPFLGTQPQVYSGVPNQPPFIMTRQISAAQQQGQIGNFNNNNAQEPSAQQAQAMAQAQAAAQVQLLQAQQQLQFQQQMRNQYPAQNVQTLYNLPANMNAIQPVQPPSVHTQPPPMNPTQSNASTPGLNPNANEFIPNS